jgi:hypothetical protein
MKLSYFGLKIRFLFTDLFQIQFWIRIRIPIRNVDIGSGQDPDLAKEFWILPDPDPQLCCLRWS